MKPILQSTGNCSVSLHAPRQYAKDIFNKPACCILDSALAMHVFEELM